MAGEHSASAGLSARALVLAGEAGIGEDDAVAAGIDAPRRSRDARVLAAAAPGRPRLSRLCPRRPARDEVEQVATYAATWCRILRGQPIGDAADARQARSYGDRRRGSPRCGAAGAAMFEARAPRLRG